ncbi:MAG: hypothetical protein Q9167_007942 [Letrouitia subvulpina]
MSASPQLAPAGSSSYSSSTMHVGDGTWDTERDTFLLPNLVGFNFATMRYNGMGNRFRELHQYHTLILAHGIIAAITFLFLIPVAIMLSRFSVRSPRRGQRYHIWLSILAVLLATVVFILGFIAVGPKRSLSNPHHGIGVAIYVLILAETFGGAWIRHKARKHRPTYQSFSYMLHNWVGRATALLGFVQIPLGLTLYGSPKYLFVLYTLAAVLLLVIYFFLSHRLAKRGGYDYDSRDSYASGSVVEERHGRSRISSLLKAGAVGVGIAALANRFRNRSRSRSPSRSHPEVIGSRRHSRSDVGESVDEKYSQYGRDPDRQGGSWRDRLLAIGAVAGAAGLARKYFGRRDRDRDRDRDSDVGEYGPPLGGATAINPDPVERLEEGRPLHSNLHPLNQPPQHRRSTSSLSYDSYMSASQEGRGGHGLRNAVAGLGALGLARNIFKKRREKKEHKRLEAFRQRELEEERRNRANGQRFTGDGYPRHGGRRGSLTTSTGYTDSVEDAPRRDPGLPPPLPAGAFPVAAGAAVTGQERDRTRQGPLVTNVQLPPPPPPGGPGAPVQMPPIPPDPQGGIFHQESSASSIDGRHHRRRRSGRNSAAATAGVAAAGESAVSRDRRQSASGGGEGSVASPPVSVKVKMHSDGRHVTLRRLPKEEAAAERAARTRSKAQRARRRAGSASTLSGTDGDGNRWRRNEAIERQQTEDMRAESERLAAARNNAQPQQLPVSYPPPPPVPSNSGGPPPGPASVGSPGMYDTEASADYANNRRRRRAERAQARQAREAGGGQNVEFT